jgi:disulfide bond formation protein DsbB
MIAHIRVPLGSRQLALRQGVGNRFGAGVGQDVPEAIGIDRFQQRAAAGAGTATAGSLWSSEVAGFIPCELCWFQRIAMYPLAVLLPLAAIRRDDAVRPYVRALAGLGLALSVWHVLIQRVPALSGTTSCAADAPCTAMWVNVFGVMTIPTMAAFGFFAVLALSSLPRPVSSHT